MVDKHIDYNLVEAAIQAVPKFPLEKYVPPLDEVMDAVPEEYFRSPKCPVSDFRVEDHIGDLLASHPLPCPAEHRLADLALSADRHQVVCLCEPGSGAAEELLHRAGCHDEGGRLLSKCIHAMLPMLPTH